MYPGSGRTFSTDVIPAHFPAFVTSELLRRFKAKGRFKVNFLDTIDGRPIEVTWPIKSNQIKRLALFNRRVLNTEYSQKLANLWPSITIFWLTMVRFSRAQTSITGAIPWMQHKTASPWKLTKEANSTKVVDYTEESENIQQSFTVCFSETYVRLPYLIFIDFRYQFLIS